MDLETNIKSAEVTMHPNSNTRDVELNDVNDGSGEVNSEKVISDKSVSITSETEIVKEKGIACVDASSDVHKQSENVEPASNALYKDMYKNEEYIEGLTSLTRLCAYGSDSDEGNNKASSSLPPCGLGKNNYRMSQNVITDDSEADSGSSDDESSSSSSSSTSSTSTPIASTDDSDSDIEVSRPMRQDIIKQTVPKTKGELSLEDLPPIEDLYISVEKKECIELGKIENIVDTLVVVQALKNTPPLDLDSVLFLEQGERPLGRIFDVFGPVIEPCYCIRFNSLEHIQEKGIEKGMPVYCAPRTEHSAYIFLPDLLKIKGTDASWEHNNEPPSKFVEFSDDEEERMARRTDRTSHRQPRETDPDQPSRKKRNDYEQRMNSRNLRMSAAVSQPPPPGTAEGPWGSRSSNFRKLQPGRKPPFTPPVPIRQSRPNRPVHFTPPQSPPVLVRPPSFSLASPQFGNYTPPPQQTLSFSTSTPPPPFPSPTNGVSASSFGQRPQMAVSTFVQRQTPMSSPTHSPNMNFPQPLHPASSSDPMQSQVSPQMSFSMRPPTSQIQSSGFIRPPMPPPMPQMLPSMYPRMPRVKFSGTAHTPMSQMRSSSLAQMSVSQMQPTGPTQSQMSAQMQPSTPVQSPMPSQMQSSSSMYPAMTRMQPTTTPTTMCPTKPMYQSSQMQTSGSLHSQMSSQLQPTSPMHTQVSSQMQTSGSAYPQVSSQMQTYGSAYPQVSSQRQTSGGMYPQVSSQMQTSGSVYPQVSSQMQTSSSAYPQVSSQMQTSGSAYPQGSSQVQTSGSTYPQVSSQMQTSGSAYAQVPSQMQTSGSTYSQVSSQMQTSGSVYPQVSSQMQTSGSAYPQLSSQMQTSGSTYPQVSSQMRTSGSTYSQVSSQMQPSGSLYSQTQPPAMRQQMGRWESHAPVPFLQVPPCAPPPPPPSPQW